MKGYMVMVLANHFVFYDLSKEKTIEVRLPIEPYPGVPFYHYLWNLGTKKDGYYNQIMLEQITGSKRPFMLSTHRKFFLIVPDDTTTAELNFLESFFSKYMAGDNRYTLQYGLPGQENADYIFISQTCRSFVFSYVSGLEHKAVKFLPLHVKEEEAFRKIIVEFQNEGVLESTPIFVNRSEKNNIPYGIGQELSLEQLFDYEKNKLHLPKRSFTPTGFI